MAAEPTKKEEKKEAKKDDKKKDRPFLVNVVLFLLTFGVIPVVFVGGCLLLAYLAFGGQITWHGI